MTAKQHTDRAGELGRRIIDVLTEKPPGAAEHVTVADRLTMYAALGLVLLSMSDKPPERALLARAREAMEEMLRDIRKAVRKVG